MDKTLLNYTSPLPRIAYLPAIGLLVGLIATLFLPETDAFDFVRGLFFGMFAVVAVATIVGVLTWRRRRKLWAETEALESLEPLRSSTEFPER